MYVHSWRDNFKKHIALCILLITHLTNTKTHWPMSNTKVFKVFFLLSLNYGHEEINWNIIKKIVSEIISNFSVRKFRISSLVYSKFFNLSVIIKTGDNEIWNLKVGNCTLNMVFLQQLKKKFRSSCNIWRNLM